MVKTPRIRHESSRFRRARWLGLLVGLMVSGLLSGCNSLRLVATAPEKSERVEKEPAPTLPGKKSLRVSQFVFLSDVDLKADLPLFQELAELRDQVYQELQLPSANNLVQVYLFDDKDRYERYMKTQYPYLPKRRAFFVAQVFRSGGPEELCVYTYLGERIQQDLRHELTHALLHSVLKGVPLWLDEGLAEYFEVPPSWRGVHNQHLQAFRAAGSETFQPDLNRLEELSKSESPQQVAKMTPPEYRESWAWVHLMLRGKPEGKAVLLAYLQQLRTTPKAGFLQPRLTAVYPNLEEALVQHVQALEDPNRPVPTAQR
jgi:hypothetical protein